MKKIGIITIIDRTNLGNRLQNYALQEYLKSLSGMQVYTLNNENCTNNVHLLIFKYLNNRIISLLKKTIKKIIGYHSNSDFIRRNNHFLEFDKNINYYSKIVNAYTKMTDFDYVIVGSDQVWNPSINRLTDIDLLKNVNEDKRISYAASIGTNSIDEKLLKKIKNELVKFKKISVREESGKKIIEKATGRTDIKVLIDPTMLLTKEDWFKMEKKPEKLKSKKYILNYFLGELSERRKKEIERVAKKYNCDIINLLDINDPLYESGPSEFLYLEKNAFLICTDSFHSSVFAILYNKPFIIFKREQNNMNNMFSRIETLLDKFQIENRIYNEENIIEENLECDYTKANDILKKEREKSKKFLEEALDIDNKQK